MALKLVQTATGVGLGIVADAVYKAVGRPGGDLPIEHSHVGLASLILAVERPKLASVATGFGVTLIVEDAFQGDPSAQKFTLGLYAIEAGILVARAYHKRG